MRIRMVLLAAILAVPLANARPDDGDANKVVEKPVRADTPDSFAEQTAWIEQEMQADGRYEFTRPAERDRVMTLLGQMASLLQRAGSVAAMDQPTRVELFNDQEEVNAILKHNDANRLVCESRAPVGSHIPVTRCHTFRQIEATARNTRVGLQQFDHSQLCNGANPEIPCAPGKLVGGGPHGH